MATAPAHIGTATALTKQVIMGSPQSSLSSLADFSSCHLTSLETPGIHSSAGTEKPPGQPPTHSDDC